MLVELSDTALLNIDDFTWGTIVHESEKEKVLKPKRLLGIFKQYETKTKEKYILKINYKYKTETYSYNLTSNDRSFLESQLKSIKTQLREGHMCFVNKAFEENVLKD